MVPLLLYTSITISPLSTVNRATVIVSVVYTTGGFPTSVIKKLYGETVVVTMVSSGSWMRAPILLFSIE